MARTKKSLVNLVSSITSQLIVLAIGIISTPFLLRWLGDDRYGAFRAATDWSGYLQLLLFGLDGALLSLFALAVGEGDREKVEETLAVGIRAYVKALVFMGIAALLLGWALPQLVRVKSELIGELQQGYWVGVAGLLLIPLAPFQLLTQASQRSHVISAAALSMNLSITGLTLLLSSGGWGILGQYLSTLCGFILFTFLATREGVLNYGKQVFPLIFNISEAQKAIEKQLHRLNVPTFFINLSGRVALLTDNIIVAYYLGSAAVVPFFLTQRLASIAQSQVQGIGNATWASLTELYAKQELETFNLTVIKLTRIISILGLTLLLPIAAYNHHFIRLWVGDSRFGGDGVSTLAAINGWLQGILSFWTWCIMGTGNAQHMAKSSVISSLVNVVVSLICTKIFGSTGPLLGTFVGFMAVSIWWFPKVLHTIFGTSVRQLFFACLNPLLIGVPYGYCIFLIARSHQPWGWVGLGGEMGTTAIIYLLLAWQFILSLDERIVWRDRFVKSLSMVKSRNT